MPSKLSTSSGSVCVPSYLRGTVASGAKQREKVIPKARVETKAVSVKREVKRSARRLEVARETKGYLTLTKTAKAKVTPKTCVLEGLRVKVPTFVFEQYEDSVEDKLAYRDLLDDNERQGNPDFMDLFVGRHTYSDAEGEVVQERTGWKERLLENTGIHFGDYRYCLARGIKYPLEDDHEDDE
ncbi:hypothetical protein QFC20_001585 [Naganishia adeliensis]|uniref:Uncharacterized protein n=1 Tax=Naganishia adeliensis TaxID=92952 RepID=A0ACC2WS44_9TREE|nr:hypothetical protein QFC20_001585 [Naganishia adeliensis]